MPGEKCCICLEDGETKNNKLSHCEGRNCKVIVHQVCYGIKKPQIGPWFCEKCAEGGNNVDCFLCPNQGEGAYKQADQFHWAHVVCALSIPGVRLKNHPKKGSQKGQQPQLLAHSCYICEEKGKDEFDTAVGSCVICAEAGCDQSFHATCAQAKGLLVLNKAVNEKATTENLIMFIGYCDEHRKSERAVAEMEKTSSRTVTPTSSLKRLTGTTCKSPQTSGSTWVVQRPNENEKTKMSEPTSPRTVIPTSALKLLTGTTCKSPQTSGSTWVVQRPNEKDKSVGTQSRSSGCVSKDESDDVVEVEFVTSVKQQASKPTPSHSRRSSSSSSPTELMVLGDESPGNLNPCDRPASSSSCQVTKLLEESKKGQTDPSTIVKRMTKEELERLVLDQMALLLTNHGSITALQQALDLSKERLNKAIQRGVELDRLVHQFSEVLRKFVTQTNKSNSGSQSLQPPNRVTRAVGVQVNTVKRRVINRQDASHVPTPSTVTESTSVGCEIVEIPDDQSSASASNVPSRGQKTLPPPRSPDEFSSPPAKRKTNQCATNVASRSTCQPVTAGLPANQLVLPPLPSVDVANLDPALKPLPPKPVLRVSKISRDLHFSWTFREAEKYATVSSYEIWTHHEMPDQLEKGWVQGNLINANPLPMACRFTMEDEKPSGVYNFVVRAIDIHGREGPFSDPASVFYQ